MYQLLKVLLETIDKQLLSKSKICKLRKPVILLGFLIFLSACSTTPPSSKDSASKQNSHISDKDNSQKNQSQNAHANLVKEIDSLKISNQGKFLFGILVDKRTEKFIRKIKPNEPYNNNSHELIKIYSTGFYPAFEPNKITENKASMFRNSIMDQASAVLSGVLKRNKNTNIAVLEKTNFDEDKFLRVAKSAVKDMYSNTRLTIDLKTNTLVDSEYVNVEVEITHKPDAQLTQPIFFINNSTIPAELINNIDSLAQKNLTYKLPIPTGKNQVRVSVSNSKGETVTDTKTITNKFKAKPTLHILAIGVNNFPNWGDNQSLLNAINDANLVKETFLDKGTKLFDSKINISPSTLSVDQTTKSNIENLVRDIKGRVKPNDYFMFYVASHGMIENNRYYFAPSDFSQDVFIKNGIREDQISSYLTDIPTIFRIAILDTCHSGKQVEAVKHEIGQLSLGKKEGISVLSAAKSEQIANENYKGHGLFTYVLVDGLNGSADYNNDSVVDSIEIAQYVKDNVGKVSRTETNIQEKHQDAVILPNPSETYTKRFELTILDKDKFTGFQPNIFTPRESQLYIDAIQRNDSGMMNGLIRNNSRHYQNNEKKPINSRDLTSQKIIQHIKQHGSIDIDINFSVNSSILAPDEMSKLEVIAEALKSIDIRSKRILLEGHTDSDGSDFKNMTLSQKRADSVSSKLNTSFGISLNRMTPIGFGETYPVDNNETEQGKRKNRRVSIFIYE